MPARIIDMHTHPQLAGWPQVGHEPHPPEEYLRRVHGLGVERAGALAMAPRDDLATTRAMNDAVLGLAEQYDGFFYPVPSVHPLDGEEALAELDRVAAAGARWLKLHPNTQAFDVADEAVTAVVRRAAERSVTVLFDAYSPFDPAQPGKFVQLAMAVPEARLVLAHAHGPGFASLLVYDVLARYPWWPRRVWIDISATGALLAGGPFAEQFAWVLRKIGLDRVLFGSDYPLDDPRQALTALETLGFSADERAAVLYDNARELLS